MIKLTTAAFFLVIFTCGCAKDIIKDNTGLITQPNGSNVISINISTDKAAYNPGDLVNFTADQPLPSSARVRYKQGGAIVQDITVAGSNWTWKSPAADYTGYMVEVYGNVQGKEVIYGTIAIDVSSDPARFPRNGFLSAYGPLSNNQINAIMASLNRYHMNYVQFQDWEYEHHNPIAGTLANPDPMWKDIANRDNYFATVKGYNIAAHSYNMKTLSYNLAYGALSDASSAGVQDQWYLYKDVNHTQKDVFTLPMPPFKSSITFTDPSNVGWQQYIASKTNEVYTLFGFDGYQIDQVGERGTVYNYSGNIVDLPTAFGIFIQAMKNSAPQKRLVMNAVTQFGQSKIAAAPVDFLYSEVWSPNEAFSDLATIMQNNYTLGSGKKSVLAAYMNYNLSDKPGYFNTPGVILADAVIFALGGSHLELGEHMLGKEYFPNANLVMPDELKVAMISYYDFLTAYENILRDGGVFNTPVLTSTDSKLKLNNWPPQVGQVSIIGKDLGTKQVLHLINFSNANSLQWRDADGKQVKPATIQNPGFIFEASKTVKRIWVASPDFNYGASSDIAFTQTGGQVNFNIPSLQYWDMIVIEYQ